MLLSEATLKSKLSEIWEFSHAKFSFHSLYNTDLQKEKRKEKSIFINIRGYIRPEIAACPILVVSWHWLFDPQHSKNKCREYFKATDVILSILIL